MQWLAVAVVDHLDGLARALQDEMFEVGRSDVVASLVLACEPTSAEQLWDLVLPFKEDFARPRRRAAQGAMHVKLELP
jgi:hypothetical protein